ncbi:hypothetical protein ACFSLT_09370 [Novosphingobium resinovorum]
MRGGLRALGVDPARLVIVDARNDAALLRAGLDAARSSGPAAVLMESWGPMREYDLVASRRLILAAEGSRIPVVILRGDAEPRSSAAHTRWTVSSAPPPRWRCARPGQRRCSSNSYADAAARRGSAGGWNGMKTMVVSANSPRHPARHRRARAAATWHCGSPFCRANARAAPAYCLTETPRRPSSRAMGRRCASLPWTPPRCGRACLPA